jgi:hypothetical protein
MQLARPKINVLRRSIIIGLLHDGDKETSTPIINQYRQVAPYKQTYLTSASMPQSLRYQASQLVALVHGACKL